MSDAVLNRRLKSHTTFVDVVVRMDKHLPLHSFLGPYIECTCSDTASKMDWDSMFPIRLGAVGGTQEKHGLNASLAQIPEGEEHISPWLLSLCICLTMLLFCPIARRADQCLGDQ